VGASKDARVALLDRLIDHAPLFPPASMALGDALDEDRRAQESPVAFALARFVCPASRLGDLPEWRRALSVVLDAPFAGHLRAEAVEAPPAADLVSLLGLAPEVYVETPLDDGLPWRLDAIAASGFRAKVRCGGAAVPAVAELARFARGCRERGLAFKATAGLHHAVRRDGRHGLLNLVAAVLFGDEDDALGEDEPDAFRLGADGFGWRGRVAGPEEIAHARRERLHSIGSCSFFEPIEALEALGFLPREAPAR
jgi:hypothetical protein